MSAIAHALLSRLLFLVRAVVFVVGAVTFLSAMTVSDASTAPASDNAATATPKYPITPEVAHAMEVSLRGCDELLVAAEWEQKLAKSAATGVPLRIKIGRAHV